jgi:5S rRNA maturation endonuclease (ribonuclease M5)
LQEVYYQVNSKNFFALGFKNDSNGYELRSKYYKGSLKGSIKDLTTLKSSQIQPNPNSKQDSQQDLQQKLRQEMQKDAQKDLQSQAPRQVQQLISKANKTDTLLIFEGFIDFLSLFTVKNFLKPDNLKEDVIVLNTLAMLEKAIEQIKASNYKEVHLYLDTDDAGRKAVNKLMFSLDNIKIVDMSNSYGGGKDLNEGLG